MGINRMQTLTSYLTAVLVQLLMISCTLAQHTETIRGREFVVHTVKPKETLYGISKTYQVPQDTIAAYNPSAANGLKVDQVLKFPSKDELSKVPVKNTPPVSKTTTHTVKQGETLYGISRQYGVTVDEITSLNPGAANGIRVDQVLIIPVKNETVKNDTHVTLTEQIGKTDQTVVRLNKGQCDTVKNRQRSFHVALLLPFHSSGGMNTKIAVEFYGGFRVALDSLMNKGFDVTLHVYDTRSKHDTDQVSDILEKGELKNMDLIVGPLYSANLPLVAQFGAANKIPVVSPFSRSSGILSGNPYVVKVTPSEEVVARRTVKYFKTFYPTPNYILIDPGIRKDSVVHSYYYDALKELSGGDTNRFHFTKLRTGGASGKLVKGVNNVVIFPCSKEITVKDFLTKFSKLYKDYDISMVGTEEWLEFNNVEADYYEYLGLHIPTVNYASTTDTANFQFITDYQKLMKADPTEYSFKGRQVACYMLNALFTYGSATCDCLVQPVSCNCLPYAFRRSSETNGLENETIQMMIFENYAYRLQPY